MLESTVDMAEKIMNLLKVGGPYAIMVVEAFVIWKLWQKNEELHKKLERK